MASSLGRTVLLVEDDYSSLEVLVLLMRGAGLEVVSASDGDEAWAKLLAEPGIGLVVTDYMMPRLDGVELCRRMMGDARFANIPVIIMSATWREKVERLPPIVDVFAKPLLFDDLLAKVQAVLDGRP
jgi:DNA-binding response OmpR family regulator